MNFTDRLEEMKDRPGRSRGCVDPVCAVCIYKGDRKSGI